MKLKQLTSLAGLCCSLALTAQIKIGDNPQHIAPASVLELESNKRVLVITRVTTTEMNKIAPLEGALAYNTDTNCIHYYNGLAWINLCESPGLRITADPVVHQAPSVLITKNGDSINLEVGNIAGEQIIDLSIGGAKLQNRSIGGEKLGAGSVGSVELRDGTVGDKEINFNELTLNDFLNDAGFISGAGIISNETGNVITDRNGVYYDDSDLHTSLATLTAAIAEDRDATNEMQLLSLDGIVLSISGGNSVNLSPVTSGGTDDQNLTGASLNGNVLLIEIEDGSPVTVDLSALTEGQDDQTAREVPFLPTGNTLSSNVQSALVELQSEIDGISAGGTANPTDELQELQLDNTVLTLLPTSPTGGSVDLDPIFVSEAELAAIDFEDPDADPANELQEITSSDGSVIITSSGINYDLVVPAGSDDQNLTAAILTGTDLTINIEDGAPVTADLSSFPINDADADPTNEIQNITSADGSVGITPSGNNFDLSVAGGGTDDQDLTAAVLSGSELTIGIEDGAAVTADLSSFPINDADADPTNEIQNITSADGSVGITPSGNNFDLSVAGGGTDDQDLTAAVLSGTELTISIEDGAAVTADLSSFPINDADADPTNEIQNITSADGSVGITPSGNNFDLSVAGGGTDDQDLTAAVLSGTELTISIEDGAAVVADLSALATDTELALLNIDDADADPTNEIQNISSPDASIVINQVGNNFELSVAGTMGGTNLSNTDLTQTGGDRVYQLDGQNLSFDGSGSIGIGTDSPQSKLHVSGEVRSSGYANSNGVMTEPSYAFTNDTDTGMWRGANVNYLRFSTAGVEALTINPDQNIGLGTINPAERLHVIGNIMASGTITPDYVFEEYLKGRSTLKPEYKLLGLKDVESFIKRYGHLPGVPSAREVEKTGGILINRATMINLEKIEELFLHAISQEKKIWQLRDELSEYSSEIHKLKKELDATKALLKRFLP